MFTGIVHNRYPVAAIEHEPGLMHLEIDLGDAMTEGLEIGASVSVSGVCLTAVRVHEGRARFDVIAESVACTSLGTLKVGDFVNIERAARFGDEIGGHDVSGHINGVGEVVGLEHPAGNCIVTIKVAPSEMKYLFHKGYVALDGASLTIAAVNRAERTLQVHLIPETLARTTFGLRTIGDPINIEPDPRTVAVVDTVEAVLDARLAQMIAERTG